MKFLIDKPKMKNFDPAKIFEFLESSLSTQFIDATTNPKYLYWNKVRYLKTPDSLTSSEYWKAVKISRSSSLNINTTLVKDENNKYFQWLLLNRYNDFINKLNIKFFDQNKSIFDFSKSEKNQILKSSLIEEAIASSQIEGANTTRKVAKKMLLENRKANNTSEQMILNNYQTILSIESNYKNEPLDEELLITLHNLLTKNTLNEEERGRFRNDNDEIVVSSVTDDTIYHIPPKKKFLMSEIKQLINYANDTNTEKFICHPIIKAIIIHFWVGYLHPFTDGNGRLARALFYWYLLKNDYWYFSYIPLSTVIKKSSVQYRDAYIYSEQDDNDLTYFIDYIISKIELSVKEFEIYIKKKDNISKTLRLAVYKDFNINNRQFLLLQDFKANTNYTITIKTHSNINNITRMTARKDLLQLKEQGFLTTKKSGKYVYYFATEKITELFD